jgi:hypothetical protein
MGILSAITGAALFYALLLSPCFSCAGAKKELGLALGAWNGALTPIAHASGGRALPSSSFRLCW